MSDPPPARSDYFEVLETIDFEKLAQRFGIPSAGLQIALADVADGLDHASLVGRPAKAAKVEQLRMHISKARDLLAESGVNNRIVIARINETRDKEDGEVWPNADYVSAQSDVDELRQELQKLEDVVAIALRMNLPPGRPTFEEWYEAAARLKKFWADELGFEPTISGHANDGRNVKTSAFVQFVTECLRQVGADISEQSCRTLLLNLRKMEWDPERRLPYGVT